MQLSNAEIRPWQASDAESLAHHANDRDVWKNLRDGFPHPYRLEDAKRFLSFTPDTFFCIAVDDQAAGGIGLSRRGDVERYSAELGYWLGRAFWGRGIITEAVEAVSRHGFDDLGLERIYALPYAHNQASCRVLEKCGFVLEGVMRRSAFKEERFVDQIMYGRIRGEEAPPPRHALTILAVTDVAKGLEFYRAALGWTDAVRTPVYAELVHPDGRRLGLYQRDGYERNTGRGVVPPPTEDMTTATELYLYAADLEASIRAFEAAGAVRLSELSPRDWGDAAAYYADPFGNVVVIAQPVGP